MPHADGRGVRPPHPAFAKFNAAAAALRQSVTGHLVHHLEEDCFTFALRNQVPRGKTAHPQMRPWCTGDGQRATRWMGGASDDFQSLPCGNERCEYRLGASPSCKPWMRLVFRLAWPGGTLPDMLVKFTSASWFTTRSIVGLFATVRSQAQQFGITEPSFFGLPVRFTIGERTTKSHGGRRFPVVIATAEYDPAGFFASQAAQREALRGYDAPLALTDDTDDTDYAALMPGASQGEP